MWKDKIVEELHKFREAHAAQFNYDVRAIVESLREEEEKSGRKVVSFAKGRKEETKEVAKTE